MSNDRKSSERSEKTESPAAAPGRMQAYVAWLRQNWLISAILTLLILHGVGLAVMFFRSPHAAGRAGHEVSLGEFRFVGDHVPGSRLNEAKFKLHISLLSNVDSLGRWLLQTNRYRVQQDIEELLRKAHAGDFEDPSLADLKRQLQETINKTLGNRVIDEVIITDLLLDRVEEPPVPVSIGENPGQRAAAIGEPSATPAGGPAAG
jgi:flagellar basal body-associated protein FliL